MNKYIKIVLSILSVINIYIITNLSSRTIHQKGNILNFFIHSSGEVCPFGVLAGKLVIPLGIIQLVYLYLEKYDSIRIANIIVLVITVLLSFMNDYVCINIIPAFILQLIIIMF
jgi:hypothetical protein